MSARDEQPVTVPPPAGEDDAYSATTKVGAMPAEVMAKLRAEGLLPEEEEQTSPTKPQPPRPATNLAPKPRPAPAAGIPSDGELSFDNGVVPALYSTAPPGPPPAPSSSPIRLSDNDSAPPTPPVSALGDGGPELETGFVDATAEELGLSVIPGALETPIAFSNPESTPSAAPAAMAATPNIELNQEVRAFAGRRTSKTLRIILIALAMAVVIGVLFLMALLSQRR